MYLGPVADSFCSACFAKRGSQNLIFSFLVLPIKVDVENLFLCLVIDNTLRPHTIGSLLMNTQNQ